MFGCNCRDLSIAAFIGLILVWSSSTAVSQEPDRLSDDFVLCVSLSDVLTGLGDQSIKHMSDRNRELVKAIDERGVGFGFGDYTRDVLSKAGANESLLSAIARGQKKRLSEIKRLDKLFREIYADRDVETRRQAIGVARELLDRVGDPDTLVGEERGFREIVRYLKEALPKMEASLNRLIKSQPHP